MCFFSFKIKSNTWSKLFLEIQNLKLNSDFTSGNMECFVCVWHLKSTSFSIIFLRRLLLVVVIVVLRTLVRWYSICCWYCFIILYFLVYFLLHFLECFQNKFLFYYFVNFLNLIFCFSFSRTLWSLFFLEKLC